MSLQSRRELLAALKDRYWKASRLEKAKMLDEFVAATGYQRDYAITLLNHPPAARQERLKRSRKRLYTPEVQRVRLKRSRKRLYTPEVQRVLVQLWKVSRGLCAKRLVAALPDLIDSLERHEGWRLDEKVRERLLGISPASADRLLAPARQIGRAHV